MNNEIIMWTLGMASLSFVTGLLVMRKWPGPAGQAAFALYLLGVSAGVLCINAAVSWISGPSTASMGSLFFLTAPLGFGALPLLLFQGRDLPHWPPILHLAAIFLIITILVAGLFQISGMLFNLMAGFLALIVVLRVARTRPQFLFVLSMVSLLGLRFLNSSALMLSFFGVIETTSGPLVWILMLVWILFSSVPFLVAGLAAAHVYHYARTSMETGGRLAGIIRWTHPVLAVLLLIYLAYTIYWASIWDQTNDGFGGLFLALSVQLIAVAAGIALVAMLKGRLRFGGVAFGVLAPLLFIQALNRGMEVSYHELTENRAALIEQALERYHLARGSYPMELSELTPRYLLQVPEPVILRDVGWCYRGGENYYQLGTFYREFFGLSVSFRIYNHAGDPPDSWMCEEKMEYVHTRHPIYGSFNW
jgi:hypothetical protein